MRVPTVPAPVVALAAFLGAGCRSVWYDPPHEPGIALMLAQCVAEAATSSPVARAVAEPLDRCDACADGEDAGREVV
jgi:hypothetical protein